MEMEGIFEVAKAHYANLSETGKQEVRNRFTTIDSDGDGVVSRRDYKNYITKDGYKTDVFDVLDKNGDGKMDFDEFITFNFIHERGYTSCSRCHVPLFGLYFFCVKCHDASKTYHLCCKCYGKKSYDHFDDHTDFRDIHSLIQIKKSTPAPAPAPAPASQSMMEDLVKTAGLYLDISSLEVKKAARNFFNALDDNKDGEVSVQEFLTFMRQQGHVKMSNRNFFKQINRRGNGLLGFKEVMAVYYIIKSGRPFCCGCDEFIPGMYFTCSKCFGNGSNLFCVCPKCIEDGTYFHEHNNFLDNYALLEAKRLQGNATFSNQHQPSSSVTTAELPASTIDRDVQYNLYNNPYNEPKPDWGHLANTTNAVVPYNNKPKPEWSHLAFKGAEVLLKSLNLAITTASFGVNCTIM